MPGTWEIDDFTEGGLASIEEFVGRLTEVQEDVEGKFGDQLEFHYEDVEIVEAGDDVTLDEGRLTSWVKQSGRKNSVNSRMVADMVEFAKAHDMGPIPSCFEGLLIRYKRATYEFGEDMSPGRAFIPTELIEEGDKKKKSKTTAKTKGKTTPAAPPPEEETEDSEESNVPEVLVTVIHEVVGEDGATREMIRRALTKKAAIRKALTEAGGLDEVLSAMEDTLDEEDGTYTRVESEDDPI